MTPWTGWLLCWLPKERLLREAEWKAELERVSAGGCQEAGGGGSDKASRQQLHGPGLDDPDAPMHRRALSQIIVISHISDVKWKDDNTLQVMGV